MPYDSHINVRWSGTQGGQTCFNELDYSAEIAVSGSYAEDIANFVYANQWSVLQPLVCAEFQLLSIEVQTIDTVGGVGYSETFVLDVGELGTNTGDPLPPNVTIRTVKTPNNSTIEPSGAQLFKKGFAGWSGAAEHEQSNGLMDTTSRLAWQGFADTLMYVEATVGGTLYEWGLSMHRGEVNPDKVLVSTMQVSQRVGTRNSRKR